MVDFSIEEFENDSQENDVRYWEARRFMEHLGYETWSAFQHVITRAMGSCVKLNLDPTESFIPFTHIVEGKEVKTYKLRRFACFLITMNGDSKKPQVMRARAILAAIAEQLIKSQVLEQDLSRVEARDDLRLAEKMMSGVARDAGLETQHFGIFKDEGFRGMYNMGLQQLMIFKRIPQGERIYDFMGLDELAGNLFRVTQTKARIVNQNVRGLSQLSKTARDVGREVRGMMIKNSGTAPEALPTEPHILTVTKRVKSVAREMKKLDGSKKKLKPA